MIGRPQDNSRPGLALILVMVCLGAAAAVATFLVSLSAVHVLSSADTVNYAKAGNLAESGLSEAAYFLSNPPSDLSGNHWTGVSNRQLDNSGSYYDVTVTQDIDDTSLYHALSTGHLLGPGGEIASVYVQRTFRVVQGITIPIIESTTISKETGGSENFVVSMPPSRPDGDLYIAQIAQEGGANINSIPSGWTEITDRKMGGNIRFAAYWKIGSSESATYTWGADSSKKWIGAIHRISGINTSSPINVSTDGKGNNSSPTAPSVTTTVDNCLILRTYGAEGDEQASAYWPSGTTAIFQDDSSGNVVTAAAYEYEVSAGSTGTGAFSMTGGKKWVAATIAVAPDP